MNKSRFYTNRPSRVRYVTSSASVFASARTHDLRTDMSRMQLDLPLRCSCGRLCGVVSEIRALLPPGPSGRRHGNAVTALQARSKSSQARKDRSWWSQRSNAPLRQRWYRGLRFGPLLCRTGLSARLSAHGPACSAQTLAAGRMNLRQ